MAKFIRIVLLVLLCRLPEGAYANGAGAQGGYSPRDGGSCALTVRPATLPLVFRAEGTLGADGSFSAGAGLDYWIANPVLGGFLHGYYGPGLTVGVASDGEGACGPRVASSLVVGLNAFVSNPLEVYLQAAVQAEVTLIDGIRLAWDVPCGAGFRWWF